MNLYNSCKSKNQGEIIAAIDSKSVVHAALLLSGTTWPVIIWFLPSHPDYKNLGSIHAGRIRSDSICQTKYKHSILREAWMPESRIHSQSATVIKFTFSIKNIIRSQPGHTQYPSYDYLDAKNPYFQNVGKVWNSTIHSKPGAGMICIHFTNLQNIFLVNNTDNPTIACFAHWKTFLGFINDFNWRRGIQMTACKSEWCQEFYKHLTESFSDYRINLRSNLRFWIRNRTASGRIPGAV